MEETKQKEKKDYFLPISLIIAAIVVAGAIIYSNGMKTTDKGNNTGVALGQQLTISADEFVAGDTEAPITLFEYSDYECPYCVRFYSETRPLLMESYVTVGKAKTVFRALAYHETSPFLMNAVACGADQGKYFEMHDFIFTKTVAGEEINKDVLLTQAGVLGMDTAQLATCVDDNQHQTDILNSSKQYQDSGFVATPIMVIAQSDKLPIDFDPSYLISQLQTNQSVITLADGAVAVIGAQPFSVYQAEIEKLLK